MDAYRCDDDDDKDKEICRLVTNKGCSFGVCEMCLLHVSVQRDHLKVMHISKLLRRDTELWVASI